MEEDGQGEQHVLIASAGNWICNLPNTSLAFLLADNGYDVWMRSTQRNTCSRKHFKFSAKSPEFWAFSLDEMDKYDLPAIINFFVEKTRQERLYCVGHSQGSSIGVFAADVISECQRIFFHIHERAYVAFSTNPEVAKRIMILFALAPVITVKYTQSPMKKLTLSRKVVKGSESSL
ncbi:lipase member K-like isoform X2 [Equus przewalskii]|uniref:Lipase member K-like isoform X2 n=1 Tax=Equus przewalskii TaxID=9798 RepID=A0ABM4NPW4_EQUPR